MPYVFYYKLSPNMCYIYIYMQPKASYNRAPQISRPALYIYVCTHIHTPTWYTLAITRNIYNYHTIYLFLVFLDL